METLTLRQRKPGANAASKDTPKVNVDVSKQEESKKQVPRETFVSKSWGTLVALTLLSFLVRLFKLSLPAQVVFDEVHFGKFASQYIKGVFFMDVHPPLGKLLVALSGVLAGYKGDFSFEKIGLDYDSKIVPYVAMRLFPGLLGVLMVPIAYLTMRNMRVSNAASLLTAMLVLFDNALTAQSRLILLDSFLLFFSGLSAWMWSEFKVREIHPFSAGWWISLFMTGVSLGLAVSVKWVGLFVIALVGVATVSDLWALACNPRVQVKSVVRHFLSRASCLIVVPLAIYLAFFQVHFGLVSRSGSASGYMSPEFQATLRSSVVPDTVKEVAFGSKVYIRHDATQGGYLHSHAHYYPTGSKQQQITCYAFSDSNNLFEIKHALEQVNGTSQEKPVTEFERVKHGDTIRLEHVATNKRLHSHDHRGPVTDKKSHNEVSGYGDPSDPGFIGDSNDHWRVDIINQDPAHHFLDAITSKFQLIHINTGCRLFSHDLKLPEWGFKQQEVTCATNGRKALNVWRIEHNEHPEMPQNVTKANYKKLTFSEMVTELHKVMWKINSSLKGAHPFASRPMSWPLLQRGIKYWNASVGTGQIYLIGNPIIWLLCAIGLALYVVHAVVMTVLDQRKIQILPLETFRALTSTGWFFFLGWALHYIPFFVMDRELFIHHYLPALYFSILLFGAFFDSLTTRVQPAMRWILSVLLLTICIASFIQFSPLSYGLEMSSSQCQSLKWRSKWDFDCRDQTNATGILHTLAPQAVGAEGDIDGNMEEADQEINTAL